MTYFLTSSPCLAGEAALNPANGFVEELEKVMPNPCKCLFVCSDPEDPERTDRFAEDICVAFEQAGFVFESFDVLDRRNEDDATQLVWAADVVILAGGHVPTQNRFFQQIGLREILADYPGIVIGISAGTMNSANVVYAQPELEGEAISPEYQRFLPGLGLTQTMVLPHYQIVRDSYVDGLHLYEDVTCPDSMGRQFYALVDGSYLYGHDGIEELRGEAYLIEDGQLRQISEEGDVVC